LGYRWTKTPSGQYVDGHEREDIVTYCQNVFIPEWTKLQQHMHLWEEDNLTVEQRQPYDGKRVVIWHHDELTFYTNDC
jgi:hypothetical protein